MNVDPSTADSTSNLTISVTPSHSIPAGGYLKISFTAYWSLAVYQQTIVSAQSACLGITVVPA
jgi:hypothetical protein